MVRTEGGHRAAARVSDLGCRSGFAAQPSAAAPVKLLVARHAVRRGLAPPAAAGAVAPAAGAAGASLALPLLLLPFRAPRRRGQQPAPRAGRRRLKATATVHEAPKQENLSVAEALIEVQLDGQPCQIREWFVDAHFSTIDAWLDSWKGGARGSGDKAEEVHFWRQRTLLAMQQKLQAVAFAATPGDLRFGSRPGEGGEVLRRRAVDRASSPGFHVYALHAQGSPSDVPMALALAMERPFPLANLRALHLEQLVTQPAAGGQAYGGGAGPGAALVRGLACLSGKLGLVLTVEPQSSALEQYFARLGFCHAPAIDPYAWFLVGGAAGPTVELRYILPAAGDYERLLGAFKRQPLWLANAEDVFFTARGDDLARNVLAVTVSKGETVAQATAWVRHFQRSGPGAAYVAGTPESVAVVDAMGVTRNLEALDAVDWASARALRPEGASTGSYVVYGRCSASQRTYPMPGLTKHGIELVTEKCELPMSGIPVASIYATVPFGLLCDAAEAFKQLLDRFKVRAVLHRNSVLWNLELVQSNGLVAATMEVPALEEDPEDDSLFH